MPFDTTTAPTAPFINAPTLAEVQAGRLRLLADLLEKEQPYIHMSSWNSCLAGWAARRSEFPEFVAAGVETVAYDRYTDSAACAEYFGTSDPFGSCDHPIEVHARYLRDCANDLVR